MEEFAPVIVFAYARKDHLKATLEALNKSALAPKTKLFIYCDNYKKEKDKQNVCDVRNYVDEFVKISLFKETTVSKAEENMGLKKSVIHGVTQVMREYGRAIVVEDDLESTDFFLEYMNSGLDFYKDNKKIWSISGYTANLPSLSKYNNDVYFAGRGCSWGWASWYDRWETIDWEVSSYKNFKHSWKKRHNFSKWGADLPPMLDYQMRSNINSWAVIWCYEAYKQDALTVYPKYSYIKNLGNDGSGSHGSNAEKRYEAVLNEQKEFECEFCEPFIDKKIRKDFYKKYTGGPIIFIKDQIKSFLKRNGLMK